MLFLYLKGKVSKRSKRTCSSIAFALRVLSQFIFSTPKNKIHPYPISFFFNGFEHRNPRLTKWRLRSRSAGISQNLREKTGFCLEFAFSVFASKREQKRKNDAFLLRAAALRRRQPKNLNLRPVRRLLRIGSRRSRERLSGSRWQVVHFSITVKRNACKFLLFLFLFCTRKENDPRERSSLSKSILYNNSIITKSAFLSTKMVFIWETLAHLSEIRYNIR